MPRRPMLRAAAAVLVATVALVAALALAACAGSPQSSPSSSSLLSVPTVALDSPQGGFSISYPADFVKVEPSVDPTTDAGLVYQVLLADPTGAKSGGSALDVLGVTVRRMSKAAAQGDLARHKVQFEAMAAQLIGKLPGLKLVAPFSLTKLGGQAALRTAYVYKAGGADVAAVAYLMPAGERVYWVTGQASKGTWPTSGRVIGASLATFSLKH
ncbi:MAG TPA: hypothetical protein VMH50_00430 [Thermoleophilia bacterium]|nr:hypothetical protein [Thermoleophilia bacterium]